MRVIFPINTQHKSLDKETYSKVINYLYFLVFESLWKHEEPEPKNDLEIIGEQK